MRNRAIKTIRSVCAVCLCTMIPMFMITGCGGNTEDAVTDAQVSEASGEASRDFFAMDTYMTVTAYGENAEEAAERAESEVSRLDNMLNASSAQSEIGRLNAEGSGTLSAEAGALVERGLRIGEMTDGLFDIAVYPIMDAWGFTDKDFHVPSAGELNELLDLIHTDDVHYDPATREVAFAKEGMAIDLGGIAKGYTSSRIMEIYRECGIQSGLVNLGGNVQVLGVKPDGSRWRVAVQSPDDAQSSDDVQSYIGVLEVQDTAVITSGAYERNFEQNGKVYHHIIDPSTGMPAESGLKSVTIISEDGTLADALSTSLYIMGKENATAFWQKHQDMFDFILMDDDNELYVTAPVADSFTSEQFRTNIVK